MSTNTDESKRKDVIERHGLLNRIIEFSLRNRLLVTFAIVLASVLGLMAYRLQTAARNFPAGTTPPVLSSAASRLGEIMQVYVAKEGGEVDKKELKETADYLIRYKLQTVPGIIRITSHGGERRQYEGALD